MNDEFVMMQRVIATLTGERVPQRRPKIQLTVAAVEDGRTENFHVRADRTTASWSSTRESDGHQRAFDGATGRALIGDEVRDPDVYIPANRLRFLPAAMIYLSELSIWGRSNDYYRPQSIAPVDDETVRVVFANPIEQTLVGAIQINTEYHFASRLSIDGAFFSAQLAD